MSAAKRMVKIWGAVAVVSSEAAVATLIIANLMVNNWRAVLVRAAATAVTMAAANWMATIE